jgi:hypothetical protein
MPDTIREDWGGLSDAWTRPATAATSYRADALCRRVVRHGRWMFFLLCFEVLITAGAMVSVVGALLRSGDAATRVLCGGLMVFTVRIWIFALRNRRGTWRAHAETVEAFRALERARLARLLTSTQFTRRLCAWTILGLAAWWTWQESAATLDTERRMIIAGAIAYLGLWIAGAWLIGARTRARLAQGVASDDREVPPSGN